MDMHVIVAAVFFIFVVAYLIRKLYLEDVRQAQREAYSPYDLLLLKNGEVVSLLMWSKEHFVCQLTDGTIEYKPWKLLKENVTYDKRSVIFSCERNFKRLNIALPIYAKKVNTPEDTVANLLKKANPTQPQITETDVNNKSYLDNLDDEQLEHLKIHLEEQGEYEKLTVLRDYIIIRQTQKNGSH